MSSAKRRPSWFQDTKTGCEKQTDYFLKIRKLQKELINREQHNLVNAMERLKQLQYPRRKPVVRNFSLPEKGMSSAFPRRSYQRKDALRRQQKDTNKMIKPLKGKNLLPDENFSLEDEKEMASFTLEDIRHLYNRMLPVLNDQQIAKIANEVQTTFPNEPSTYLLQPHLPSIPNVKRKTTTRLVNRLKLLTLSEESEYRTLSNPKIASSLLLQRKGTSYASSTSSLPDISDEKKDKKRSKRHMLYFDVDPNDTSVFVHSASKEQTDDADDLIDDDGKNIHGSPFPPPNSRPNSHVANKDPATEDSGNEPTLVESSAVSTVDMKIEENVEKPEVFQEENLRENSLEVSAQDDLHIDEPEDDIEKSVDDANDGDKPSENQSTDNVNSDINQDFDDNQLSEISISEPKVIIKTNKTPAEN